MYGTGSFRIKHAFNKFVALVALTLLGGVNFSCIDKEVACKTRYYLTIINYTENNIRARIIDSTENSYGFQTDVDIRQADLLVDKGETETGIVDFRWSDLNSCGVISGFSIAFRLKVSIEMDEMLYQCFEKFVYDSTISSVKMICTDCWHEVYDTIVIN